MESLRVNAELALRQFEMRRIGSDSVECVASLRDLLDDNELSTEERSSLCRASIGDVFTVGEFRLTRTD